MLLIVSSRRHSERARLPNLSVLNGNEIRPSRFRAIDAEAVDLAKVIADDHSGIGMVSVRTTRGKQDGTLAKPSGLALDPFQRGPVIDDQVVSGVLSKGNQYCIPHFA